MIVELHSMRAMSIAACLAAAQVPCSKPQLEQAKAQAWELHRHEQPDVYSWFQHVTLAIAEIKLREMWGL
jgi:hypothetical protein